MLNYASLPFSPSPSLPPRKSTRCFHHCLEPLGCDVSIRYVISWNCFLFAHSIMFDEASQSTLAQRWIYFPQIHSMQFSTVTQYHLALCTTNHRRYRCLRDLQTIRKHHHMAETFLWVILKKLYIRTKGIHVWCMHIEPREYIFPSMKHWI